MGLMLYVEEEGEVFLGKFMLKVLNMFDDIVCVIDVEIKFVIDCNYDCVQKIFEENIDILYLMKDVLMKYEIIDVKQIDDLMVCCDVWLLVGWDDCLLSGDKLSGGVFSKEGEIIDDGVDKLLVGKFGDLLG